MTTFIILSAIASGIADFTRKEIIQLQLTLEFALLMVSCSTSVQKILSDLSSQSSPLAPVRLTNGRRTSISSGMSREMRKISSRRAKRMKFSNAVYVTSVNDLVKVVKKLHTSTGQLSLVMIFTIHTPY